MNYLGKSTTLTPNSGLPLSEEDQLELDQISKDIDNNLILTSGLILNADLHVNKIVPSTGTDIKLESKTTTISGRLIAPLIESENITSGSNIEINTPYEILLTADTKINLNTPTTTATAINCNSVNALGSNLTLSATGDVIVSSDTSNEYITTKKMIWTPNMEITGSVTTNALSSTAGNPLILTSDTGIQFNGDLVTDSVESMTGNNLSLLSDTKIYIEAPSTEIKNDITFNGDLYLRNILGRGLASDRKLSIIGSDGLSIGTDEGSMVVNAPIIDCYHSTSVKFYTPNMEVTGNLTTNSISSTAGNPLILTSDTGIQLNGDLVTDSVESMAGNNLNLLSDTKIYVESPSTEIKNDITFNGDLYLRNILGRGLPNERILSIVGYDGLAIGTDEGSMTVNAPLIDYYHSTSCKFWTPSFTITGNLILGGNLTVNGTTSTINTVEIQVDDPIISIGHDSAVATTDLMGFSLSQQYAFLKHHQFGFILVKQPSGIVKTDLDTGLTDITAIKTDLDARGYEFQNLNVGNIRSHSISEGMLLNRLTSAQRNAMINLLPGTVIFNTSNNAVEFYNNSLTWINLTTGGGALGSVQVIPDISMTTGTVGNWVCTYSTQLAGNYGYNAFNKIKNWSYPPDNAGFHSVINSYNENSGFALTPTATTINGGPLVGCWLELRNSVNTMTITDYQLWIFDDISKRRAPRRIYISTSIDNGISYQLSYKGPSFGNQNTAVIASPAGTGGTITDTSYWNYDIPNQQVKTPLINIQSTNQDEFAGMALPENLTNIRMHIVEISNNYSAYPESYLTLCEVEYTGTLA